LLFPLRHVLCRRKLGRLPAAAERLDEQDGGGHPPAADLDRGDLVGQRDRLGGDHVEVVLLATLAVALPDLDLETAAGAAVKDATTQGPGDARRAPAVQEAKP
jgi:hypothetical protein